ncbi:MAG: heme ABC exporter ATP-binding protein CcmA [Hyphomicrobiales bacterium]|nr:MAG: heme ABC exporter ATP-binding protein CcmA [Hyphomicrobiales bacterium]
MSLIISKLVINRGERRIVGPLDVTVPRGSTLAVRGPNGAGKSTLLRALAGLLPITSGTAILSDSDDDTPMSERCHYFGHLDGLKNALTVAENLTFFQNLYGNKTMSVAQALAQVALPHTIDLPVAYLSAGMRKRVALARILLNHRPLWLLDEPTSALDTASQTRLGEMMQAHVSAGGMIIAATHLPLPGSISAVLEIEPATALLSTFDEAYL